MCLWACKLTHVQGQTIVRYTLNGDHRCEQLKQIVEDAWQSINRIRTVCNHVSSGLENFKVSMIFFIRSDTQEWCTFDDGSDKRNDNCHFSSPLPLDLGFHEFLYVINNYDILYLCLSRTQRVLNVTPEWAFLMHCRCQFSAGSFWCHSRLIYFMILTLYM